MNNETLYRHLRHNPPKLEVKENAKEVMIHLVSVMCDNRYLLKLKKNSNNEFRLHTMGFAFSNYQMKCNEYQIEWAADENKWDEVVRLINTGTSVVEKIVSR